MENLAPAGTREALDRAVAAGADAVYLGYAAFSARAGAGNFDEQQLREAVAFAHLHHVRVHVTVNTLIKEIELPDSLYDMDGNIAAGCINQLSITIPDEESHFAIGEDGALYNKKMTKLYSCPCRKEGPFVVPDSVTEIGPDAFFGCFRLTSISIGPQVAVIGADNDTSLCENARPTLSSVFLDYEHAGYRSFEVLSELIENPGAGPIRETYRALGLIRRGSTPAGIGTPPRVAKALAFIRQRACEGISAADVAKKMPGSRRLAEMDFRKATGRSILEEILRVRFERVELLLRDKSQQLGAIAAQCGWKTENALRTAFLKRYGKSMRDWRRET